MTKSYKIVMTILLVGSYLLKRFVDVSYFPTIMSHKSIMSSFVMYTITDFLFLSILPTILLLIGLFSRNLKKSRRFAIATVIAAPIVFIANVIIYVVLALFAIYYNWTSLFILVPLVLSIIHIIKSTRAINRAKKA